MTSSESPIQGHDDVSLESKSGSTHGAETVDSVSSISDVTLVGTTIKGHVEAGHSLRANKITCDSATSNLRCIFTRSTCKKVLKSGTTLQLTSSEVYHGVSCVSAAIKNSRAGIIESGTSLAATDCPLIGFAQSNTNMNLTNCLNVGRVSCGTNLKLLNTQIQNDVNCGDGVEAYDSSIGSTLSYGSNDVTLRHCKIGNIVVNTLSAWSLLIERFHNPQVAETQTQRLTLIDTVVLGNIEFVSGKGEVIQQGSTQVFGEIKGLDSSPTSPAPPAPPPSTIPDDDLLIFSTCL